MRKSVFFKLALLIIPIVLAYEIAQLYMSYQSVYNANIEAFTKVARSTAQTAASIFEFYNPAELDDNRIYSKQFDELSRMWGVAYLYVVEPDAETKSIKYIIIGFGDDAADIARQTRYAGVEVEGGFSDSMQQALTSGEESTVVHEKTELDDTLTCYRVIDTQYDQETEDFAKLDKPYLLGAEISFTSVMKKFQSRFHETAVYDLGFTLLLTVAIFVVFYFRVNGPVKRISAGMKNFVHDREKGVKKLQVKGNDELAEMSRSFNMMTEEIDRYIADIDNLSREKHTQEAELAIARNIQTGLLKPSRYENGSVCIHAVMRAARNVGGDLYDYQVLDDGSVFIAVADVSGKGISAALFMSRAITLLHQYALLGYSPAHMLGEYNNTLAEFNPNGLFITTFVAVYNPETGALTYANAGHNRPYLLSDRLIALDGAAGIAAGIFDGFAYEEETVTLQPHDVVFLYSDGVNEAENSGGALFGTEELEDELKKHIGRRSGEQGGSVSDDILKTIEAFSDGAVQSDDLTILTLEVKPKPAHSEITVMNRPENLTALNEMINRERDIPEEIKAQLLLIAEELFVNICSYAYGEGEGELTVAVDSDGDAVTLTFTDAGKPFDPTADVVAIEDYDHENSVGGLGRFLAFELSDGHTYAYRDGRNILTVTKRIR